MKRQPNYIEYLAQTNDIEVLRTAALQGQELNNKLHRRVQEHESVAAQWKIDKAMLESDCKWLRNCYDNAEKRYSRVYIKLRSLPPPINWLVMRCIRKAAAQVI